MHEMNLDGADGDGKLAGDLLVLHPAANECDDLILAWCEARQVAAVEESNHLIGNRILDPDIAASDRAKALDDGGDWKCLFQDAAHATLESAKRFDLGNGRNPKDGVAVERPHPNLRDQFESG